MATRRIPRRALFTAEARPQICPYQASRITKPFQYRTIFGVEPLEHTESFVPNGVSGTRNGRDLRFLSPQGYNLAWTQYQAWLVNNLNYITAEDPETSTMSAHAVARKFARDPDQAVLFNYASQAHNNEFFFQCLTPVEKQLKDYDGLRRGLESAFGSIEELRNLMFLTASGMFGNGYVWLAWVRDSSARSGSGAYTGGTWRVLATYNAGTPYTMHPNADSLKSAGNRQQGTDMNTAGAFGNHSAQAQIDRYRSLGGPVEVLPVLCVSVWQHVYLRDYNTFGKNEYLNAWWQFIDWEKVDRRTPQVAKLQDSKFEKLGVRA